MQYERALRHIYENWRVAYERGGRSRTVFVIGPPGIGKTSLGKDLARLQTAYMRQRNPSAPPAIYEEEDMSSRMPEDITGLPWGDEVNDQTLYRPQSWLKRLSGMTDSKLYGVLVIDDIAAALPSLQVAARQLSLARRVHETTLAPGIFVLVTGNRREDKAAAKTMPSHFNNSVQIITVEPEAKSWCEWAARQKFIHPDVIAYIAFKPEHLSMLPKDANEINAFATPRTWEMLGEDYEAAQLSGSLLPAAQGLIGKVAPNFIAFCRLRSQLDDPEAVLRDPEGKLPNPKTLDSMDKVAAMATALGEYAAMWEKGEDPELRRKACLCLMRSLSWVTQNHREFVAAGINIYLANGGTVKRVVTTAEDNKKDPLVKDLFMHLKTVFKGG